jgi:hypothetical protein
MFINRRLVISVSIIITPIFILICGCGEQKSKLNREAFFKRKNDEIKLLYENDKDVTPLLILDELFAFGDNITSLKTIIEFQKINKGEVADSLFVTLRREGVLDDSINDSKQSFLLYIDKANIEWRVADFVLD